MLNILYQFNEKYVPYAATSMVSLMENNKKSKKITFFILGEQLSEASKKSLKKQVGMYERKIIFINTDPIIKKIKKLSINDYRGSHATNMKLFAEDFIPDDIKYLLYIDSDTIVTGDLRQLENFDMKDMPVAMALDSMCRNHKQHLGFAFSDAYFNGGVILFNMERWKDLNCTQRICEHLITQRSHYMAPDQDLINIVLKGQIAKLDCKYNIQPMHLVYSYKKYYSLFGQPGYYTESEIQGALENPIIFHTFRYLGEFPWHKDSLHPNKGLFDYYIEKSFWKDYEKRPTERNDFMFRTERWLYHILPQNFFVVIFKFFYGLFMWKSNRDSMEEKNNVRM